MSWFKPTGHRQTPNRVKPPLEPASEAQKEVFLRHYRDDGRNVATACRAAEMTRAVYRRAMADDEDFRNAHAEIDDFFIDKLESVAFDMGMKSDAVMVKFLLERLRPEKYSSKSKVEMTHRIADPKQLQEMSDEDFMELYEQRKLEAD